MEIIPKTLFVPQLKEQMKVEYYLCPLCKASDTNEKPDLGWVRTPLLAAPICVGCCHDFYSLAKSNSFDENPYKSLFVDLAQNNGESVEYLRKSVLTDQLRLIKEEIDKENDDFFLEQYQDAAEEITQIIKEL